MRRIQRAVLVTALLALGPVVTGCSGFDLDKLDVFGLNEKKKLPGERKDVFPEGVPGVTQGIPPEYLKSNRELQAQQAQEAEAKAAEAQAAEAARQAAAPVEPPKAKPKPKPRTVSSAPTRITVQPAAPSQPKQSQQSQQAQPAPWPDQQPQQQQPAQAQQSPWPSSNQSSSTAPWPAAPASGTFSR
jgi:hypothetical protein